VDFAEHPFLHIIWTFFIIFVWIAWFWLLIGIVGDLFRRRDLGGGAKTIWFVFVIFLPLLGSLAYLFTQGDGMAERGAERAQAQQAELDSYIRERAGAGGAAAEIERAKALLDSGAIDQDEFAKIKARALA
jgi:hypothetical protein